ncbi:MAG TPA: DUF4124 domain-containing protein, partial [Thioalkalivibrio sp.]|nr:DUF4124 domain-containing protein [Thioalkalivibrio sp.]
MRGYTAVMNRFLLALLLLTFTATLHAEVYRWVDEEGNVQFSDKPPPGDQPREVIDLPSAPVTQTYKPSPTPPASDEERQPTEAPVAYRWFTIASPADDEPVRENAGNVTVSVDITPALQPGHRLRLYLDGILLDNGGTRTTVNLTNVSRGTHQIRAEIVDTDGKVLRRTSSTFH